VTDDPFSSEVNTESIGDLHLGGIDLGSSGGTPAEEASVPDVDDLGSFTEQWFADRTGSVFVYDLETVPDESAYPRLSAEEDGGEPADIDVDAVMKTQSTLDEAIAAGLVNQATAKMLITIEQQSKKMRKGVLASLRKVAEAAELEFKEWSKCSFDPWRCRIVAASMFFYGDDRPVVVVCNSPDDERSILSFLWKCCETGIRCGYNIEAFDDRVISARSMLLGVTPGKPMSTRSYGNKDRIDLYRILFDRGGDTMKLKSLCVRMGIDIPAGPDMNGGMVRQLVDEGRWADIANYVRSDAIVEMELLRRVQRVIEIG